MHIFCDDDASRVVSQGVVSHSVEPLYLSEKESFLTSLSILLRVDMFRDLFVFRYLLRLDCIFIKGHLVPCPQT